MTGYTQIDNRNAPLTAEPTVATCRATAESIHKRLLSLRDQAAAVCSAVDPLPTGKEALSPTGNGGLYGLLCEISGVLVEVEQHIANTGKRIG